MEQNLQQMVDALLRAHPYKIILSNPKKPALDGVQNKRPYRKIVLNQLKKGWQAEQYTEKQVFHENLSEDRAGIFLLEALSSFFRQCNGWDCEWEHTIRISKGGKASYQKKRSVQAPREKKEHNRKKNYILEEGTVIPPLVDMGIFTSEGKVVRSMYDKYRQINRFVELIDDEIDNLPKDHTITVIDFGCGKSYLTFILYYYLTKRKGLDVQITGLDLKEDVIQNCNRAARRYGYEGLHFELGDISGYDCPYPVDMVLSLHACDTATDYALDKAVKWGAKVILSVPCCQHEVNKQISCQELKPILQYGIIKERMSALITDALRADILKSEGYETDLLEFIDMEHTPKNILIRAVRKEGMKAERQKEEKDKIIDVMKFLQVEPALWKLSNSTEESINR